MNTKVALVIIGSLVLCCGLGVERCEALEKLKVFRGALVLEGKIEAGDYLSVRYFLRDEANFKKISQGVFLASQGGNVLEAMRIGSLIRALRLATDAPVPSRPPGEERKFGGPIIRAIDLVNPRQYECASACFLIYVAGFYRSLSLAGRLGIHRPRLQHEGVGLTEDKITIATNGVRNAIRLYLKKMNVPDKYLDLMYSMPPNELHWISQNEFDSDLKGYVPEAKGLLNARCNPRPDQIKIDLTEPLVITLRSDRNKLSAKQSEEIIGCLTRGKAELSVEAWHEVFRPN
jgi:hypothetical protein